MPTLTGLHHVSLTVRDLQRSTDWYCGLLDLTKVIEEAHPDGSGFGVVLADPQFKLVIGLHSHTANPGEPFSEARTGLDHASIGVPDQSELGEWERRLEERHVPHSRVNHAAYGSVLVFRDPDNIQLEFFVLPSP
jgi:catechol 2,3-dioxygenase-like lactoylglutathione lyase family enzyme